MMKILVSFCFLLIFNTSSGQSPIEWQHNFGGSGADLTFGSYPTSDSGSVIIGYTASTNGDITGPKGSFDILVIKLDAAGNKEWARNYGGPADDYGVAIQQLPDEGYILTGLTNGNGSDISGHKGSSDVFVMRLDRNGTILWQRCYGGTGFDAGFSIVSTIDGGFAVGCTTSSNNLDVSGSKGGIDIWIIKLSASGTLLWQRTIGGSTNDDGPHTILENSDGSLIVGGSTLSNNVDITLNKGSFDVWIVKLSSAGNIVWQKTFGGTDNDLFKWLAKDRTGGWFILAETRSADGDVSINRGDLDLWVIHIDNNGNLLTQKTYGGSGVDGAGSLHYLPDGDLVLFGYTNSTNGDVCPTLRGGVDYFLLRVSAAGEIVTQKTLGGSQDDQTFYGSSIAATLDGGFRLAGSSNSSDGDITTPKGENDIWIVKVDSNFLKPVPPSFSFNYRTPVCIGDGNLSPVVSSGFKTGGIYRASSPALVIDSITGIINPSASLTGAYIITYTITCPYTYSTNVSVSILGITTLEPFSFNYTAPICNSSINAAVVKSGPFPEGGKFTSSPAGLMINEITGTIAASASVAGNYTVTYERSATSCTPLIRQSISVVIEASSILSTSFSYASSAFCIDSSIHQMPVLATGFSSGGIFSASPGLAINPITGNFNPATAEAGNYTIIYTVPVPSACYSGAISTSIPVTLFKCNCQLFVPTAFTPNNDGKNDFFSGFPVAGCLIDYYNISVYNRWSNIVFTSENPLLRWDGRYKNENQPGGVYIYKIQYQFKNQSLKKLAGSFILLR